MFMKTVYISLAVIVALCLFSLGCINSCADKDIVEDAITQTATQSPTEITPKSELILIYSKHFSDGVQDSWGESFEYPFIEGGTNASNVTELNNEISQWIEQFYIWDEIKNRSVDEIPEGFEAEAEINYKVLYDGKDYKIIMLRSWWFGGGAHGSSAIKYLTFDAKTGEKYNIDYFVKDITDYKKRINDYLINKCMVAMQEENYDIDLSGAPLNFDGTENFYYDKDNDKLIIEYGEYSLSDYATHFETIEVRLNFIRDDTTMAQKILGEWYLYKATDKSGNESDYRSFLWTLGATDVTIRFDDNGYFYKKFNTSVNYVDDGIDPTKWKCEGTFTVKENAITLNLNTEDNTDPILFWRNGEIEVAYIDVETETIQYRTNWSATNNKVVYCYFA